jgi:OOP family OmpA-OmpF porin
MGMFLVMLVSVMFATNGLAAKAIVEEKVIEKEIVIEKVTLKEKYVKTADNFIILFDSSGSMGEPYKDTGMKQVEVARKILKERNQLLPELDWNAGLYTYTPFKAYLEMQPYFKVQADAAINKLPTAKAGVYREDATQDPTPLGEAIQKLDKILRKYFEVEPVPEAKKLAAKYDVCFYVFSSAKTEKAKKTLDDIAAVNQCSRVVPFDAVYQRPEYVTDALYVVKSYEVVTTETVVETEVVGEVVGFKVDDILFNINQAGMRSESSVELDAVGRFLNDNVETYVVLAGYTDGTYTREFNLELSRKRALSVQDYLMKNANIGADRFVVQWYGKDNPVADNDTLEGRAKNRRVEVTVKKP